MRLLIQGPYLEIIPKNTMRFFISASVAKYLLLIELGVSIQCPEVLLILQSSDFITY